MINKTNRHDDRVDIYSIKIMIYSVNKNIQILFHICVTMAFNCPPIERLNQCWFNAGPASQTMMQHSPGIVSTSRVCF